MRNKIVQALDARFRADLMDAKAKLEIYLENPVGVGEHPGITEEAHKLVKVIVDTTECVKYCQELYYREDELAEIDTSDLETTVNTLVVKMDKILTAMTGEEQGE